MSARRIARELAVILLPQLPKDRAKLEKVQLEQLVVKSSQMLVDYAKQCLSDADGLVTRAHQKLLEIEADHPDNAQHTDNLVSVPLTSGQALEQIELIERALHLVSEALDVPEVALESGGKTIRVSCKKCAHVTEQHLQTPDRREVREFVLQLVGTYNDHYKEIDEFIVRAKSKWKVERMVSIDRDILRLACTEAFFMPDIPLPVAINEAIELSHRFADTQAARFINGVLRDLAEEAAYFRRTGSYQESVDSDGTAPSVQPALND